MNLKRYRYDAILRCDLAGNRKLVCQLNQYFMYLLDSKLPWIQKTEDMTIATPTYGLTGELFTPSYINCCLLSITCQHFDFLYH